MYAIQVLEVLPGFIEAGKNVVEFIENTSKTLKAMQAEGRDPTDEEWTALNDQISALRGQLQDE